MSDRIYFLIYFLLMVFALNHKTFAQESVSITHSMYHQYEGNYQLPDGKYITGALMDELEGHMLFMEPIDVTMGGLFRPVNKTTFESLPPDQIQIRFEFNPDSTVKGVWWSEINKESFLAEKINLHTVEQIHFENEDVSFSGELRLPDSKGPHPVIVNVHGSGKATRHSGPWDTFFLNYGIGVLSYDKRGAGESTGDFATAGYLDFAEDVLAAIDFLKNHPGVDQNRIGLHGSSEGGWVSPIAASKSDDIAFMIVRAGPGVSGAETVMHEIKNEFPVDLTDKEYREAVQLEREFYQKAAEGKSLEHINDFVEQAREKYSWFTKVFGDLTEINPDYWTKIKKTAPIDPADYLRKVYNIPVLWFLAEKDENVPYELSKAHLKTALDEAVNKDYEIVTLPGANHAFFVPTADGGQVYTDGYWDKMSSWLKERGFTSHKNR